MGTGPSEPESGSFPSLAQEPASGASASASAASSTSGRRASDAFFAEFGPMKKRALVVVLGALVVLGIGAVPLAPWRWLAAAGAAALFVLSLLLLVAVLLAREASRLGRRPYDIAMLATLLATIPVVYLLDFSGPVIGILALALLHYGMDAPRRWSLAATLIVAIPHLTLHLLVILGWISNRGLADLPLGVRLSNLASNTFLYGLTLAIAHLYGTRTRQRLTELADAGREVATREALLREARLELERVVELGGRGRFTDQVLGPYRLGAVLGQGGLGEVYRATHIENGTAAAVKVLRPSADSNDALRRFEREAAIVGKIASPHVVRLLDVGGLEAPLPYLAMELLEGESGRVVLERTPRMSHAELRALVGDVAAGLCAAQQHNVVHRDIKPSNLFLTREGTWKVLDFGLGRIAGEAGTLTRGTLVGTLGYLAPEQLHGAAVGHATDVHALAIIAYQALTGRPAFGERDAARVFEEVEQKLPPRPSAVAGVPPAVDAVLRIALAKEPVDRFALATDFVDALSAALDGTIAPELAERAKVLDARLPWGDDAPKRTKGKRQREAATQTIPPPPDEAKPGASDRTTLPLPLESATPKVEASDPSGGAAGASSSSSSSMTSAAGSTTRKAAEVTLVDAPEQLHLSTWLAPARTVTLAFGIASVFAMTQVQLYLDASRRRFGTVAVIVLFTELLFLRKLATEVAPAAVARFRLIAVFAFATSTSLLLVFGTYGDIPAYLTIALFLFGQGVPRPWMIAATLAVALPHATMELANVAGLLPDQGFTPSSMTRAERLLLVGLSLVLYALGAFLAEVFRRHARIVLTRLSAAFRRNTEREALLQAARLALERAIGVGQPGRFTGQRFGQFVLGDVLGRGGLGEVYAATHAENGRPAAVKLMTRRQGADPDAARRFVEDAAILESLESPHLVKVLEVGHELGLPFVVMERLDGSDLGHVLDRRLVLNLDEVVNLVRDAAAGLIAAHARGLIHGDVAPRNLFLTQAGSWKVLDFAGGVAARSTTELVGTPGYMAPEQLTEHLTDVDGRIDVHALASVAYRALTGRPAFAGRDAATVLYRVIHALPPAPSSLVQVPRAVDQVLRIGLAKDPGDRFPDPAAFADALARAAGNNPADDRFAARAAALESVLGWSSDRARKK